MLTVVSEIGLVSSYALLVLDAIVQAVVKIPDRISRRLLSWLTLTIIFSALGMGVGVVFSSIRGAF